MKMDPSVTDNITLEANYLVCTATELFVRHLAKEVYEMDTRCLSYENLSSYVQNDETLDFITNICPKKITVREYKKIMAEKKAKDSSIGSGSEESSSEEESSEESESGSSESSSEDEKKDENSPAKSK
jgi:chromatin accessibility complex protein 1